MGLFSFLSQLAQEGYSSLEDSTRKRRSESVGGLEWPSLREVTFLQVEIVITLKCKVWGARCIANIYVDQFLKALQHIPKVTPKEKLKRLRDRQKLQKSFVIVMLNNFIIGKCSVFECVVFLCKVRERDVQTRRWDRRASPQYCGPWDSRHRRCGSRPADRALCRSADRGNTAAGSTLPHLLPLLPLLLLLLLRQCPDRLWSHAVRVDSQETSLQTFWTL